MEAELKQQFDDMGIDPSSEVIDKSIELCISYHIEDAAEFVEQWVAFSVSNLHGAEPTVEHLLEFERKVFQAKREKELLAASKRKSVKLPSALSNLTHLNDMTASVSSNPLAMYGVHDDDVMDEYMQDMADTDSIADLSSVCHTPKNISKDLKRKTEDLADTLLELATKRFAQSDSSKIADAWAVKLDRMKPYQRLLVEKFVEEIMYEGQIGTLNRNSLQNFTSTPTYSSSSTPQQSSHNSNISDSDSNLS